MTRTPYHSINVFWDTYRQYIPTRLFVSKSNQSLQSYELTCRRNLTAGRNLTVNLKFSRFSAPPCISIPFHALATMRHWGLLTSSAPLHSVRPERQGRRQQPPWLQQVVHVSSLPSVADAAVALWEAAVSSSSSPVCPATPLCTCAHTATKLHALTCSSVTGRPMNKGSDCW
jgi:hypothetical protein